MAKRDKGMTVSTVIQTAPTVYMTMYSQNEEREHYLARAVSAVLLAASLPTLAGVVANVRLGVSNIKSKKGWQIDQASDGTGQITIDGRINQTRAAIARALFGTLYSYTGYDARELRKLAEPVGFVFGKGKATGWAGDMTPELAQAIDDVASTLPEYPQAKFRFEDSKKRGRNATGGKNATLQVHGSPTGDDKITGKLHGGRVFVAQFAADLAKAGYWVSIEDKDTDAVLAAAESKKVADDNNAINNALAGNLAA